MTPYIIVIGLFLMLGTMLWIFRKKKKGIMECANCDQTAYMCECDADETKTNRSERCKCDGGKCQCDK